MMSSFNDRIVQFLFLVIICKSSVNWADKCKLKSPAPKNANLFSQLNCTMQKLWTYDKFTAIVTYTKEMERLAKLGICAQPRISLEKVFGDGVRSVKYTDFLKFEQTALNVANLLNHLHQSAASSRSDKVDAGGGFPSWFANDKKEQAFYYTLVRSVVESDPKVFGCMIAPNTAQPIFLPYAFRGEKKEVTIMDYTSEAQYSNPNASGFDWFHYHKSPTRHKDVFRRPVKHPTEGTELMYVYSAGILRKNSSIYIVRKDDGFWSPPVFDCNITKRWKFSYSVPFFGPSQELKGVVALEFNLMDLDINQCLNDSTFFAQDLCMQETTECNTVKNRGFDIGSYNCVCKKGWYRHQNSFYSGNEIQSEYLRKLKNESNRYDTFNCRLCGEGCTECVDDRQCSVELDFMFLRAIPLAIQSFCITVCLICGVIAFRLRRNRVIKTSFWLLLEVFLFGAILLYSTIIIMYFKPTHMVCIVLPWFREVGFAITYGTLTVKVYRVLSGFQSRKAHRVHVRDKDMLKYLGGIISVSVGYMAAWTAVSLDYHQVLQGSPDNSLLLQNGTTADGKNFKVCRAFRWDIVVELSELCFLCLALYYCYCVRSAPSDYSETKFVTGAIVNEIILSGTLHIVRHFIWTSQHPDIVFLIYFVRCHLTVTVTVALIIGPKLWYVHRPPRDQDGRTRAYSQVDSGTSEAIKLNLTSNGDIDLGEISLAEMDPEDIRSELKRVYTQMEVYKTKLMRKDNPHVSKRRGGRKQTHRRFSIQAFTHHHKHSRTAQSVQEEDISKVSEDSIGSQDGANQPGSATASAPASSTPSQGAGSCSGTATPTTPAGAITFQPSVLSTSPGASTLIGNDSGNV